MFAFLLLAFLASPGPTADSGQDITRGAALLRGCQAELRLMQPGVLPAAAQGDLVNGAYCVGYLNGFISNLSAPHGTICLENQPMGSLVGAYVGFMEQNPRLLEEEKRVGLRLALESAFPCPTTANAVSGNQPLRRDHL